MRLGEPSQRDLAGRLGESVASMFLLRPLPGRDYLFSTCFLGDKWPTADFLVELVGTTRPCFFLAQIRAVSLSPNSRERLTIAFDPKHLQALSAYPIPTYLIGVDLLQSKAYLVSANGEQLEPEAGMTVNYPLSDESVMLGLWEEVAAFWDGFPTTTPKLTSQFLDPRWRSI
ncbi:hypothetical protein [Armatimonas sp.]|uniref:hypothetical protein n=1 Tax=Armatimonas sp. TaxID=1872638 RepID=UPI00286D26C1|nr:hypothetical protein [Armatimonas sp.]